MQVEIKAQEDNNFKLISKNEQDEIADDSHVGSVTPEQIANHSKRREPTLENPKGHEWFNGTSWGLK